MAELRKVIERLKETSRINKESELIDDALELLKDYKDCVNELCYQCGQYREEHNGACDGCRWQKPRRGW